MKKMIFTALACMATISLHAQQDTLCFKGYIQNKEYSVYLQINFYDNNVKVPGQEIFGNMAGYFGDQKDGRKWLITDAQVEGNIAHLAITNDYGSEDLTADLTRLNDGSYELHQISGSTIKIARNRKWVKIPKKLIFKK